MAFSWKEHENFEHDFLFFATFKNIYMDFSISHSGKVRQDLLFLAALG
jgi:hypothetical protein